MQNYENNLNNQQKKFIAEYIKYLDAEKAARKAGYYGKNVREIVEKLLQDKAVIREIKSQISKQVSILRVHKGYVIQKLLQIAEFSLEEEEITDKDGNYTGKRKLRDTTAGLKALESLCKYLGINSEENDTYKPVKIITISNLDDKKI